MKKVSLVLILTCSCLIACAGVKEHPQHTIVSWRLLDEYNRQGFLFTTSEYFGDYEAVGLMLAEAVLGVGTVKEVTERKSLFVTEKDSIVSKATLPMDYHEALDRIFHDATRLGANAIINLRFEIGQRDVDGNPLSVEISGLAIKRLGAFHSFDGNRE